MKKLVPLWLIAILFMISCQSDENAEIPEEQAIQNEYFITEIDGNKVAVEDSLLIEGEIFKNPESGVISLTVYATAEDSSEFGKNTLITICFYDGIGVYSTGNDYNNSYCYYSNSEHWWYSDPGMGDPGMVEIIKITENFVEGEFEITAYNYEDLESKVNLKGKFGVNTLYR